MERQIRFTGTGGGLFVKFLVGMLLTMITFGIYAPWFMVNLQKYIAENVVFQTEAGEVRFTFSGTGGGLFVTLLVGYLLTVITLGIYMPWFFCKLIRFYAENSVAKSADGSTYTLQFNGTGGALFVTFLVGGLLTMITFGIYAAWFVCKLTQFYADNTEILQNKTPVGKFAFVGAGGELFVTMLVGTLLTMITFGIYAFWYEVKLLKYFYQNSQITLHNRNYACDFSGTGGEYFVINLVGGLLTSITLGIYGAWFMCKLLTFRFENTKILDRA